MRRRSGKSSCRWETLPEDVWVSILTQLPTANDVCRLMAVHRIIDTDLVRDALAIRMCVLSGKKSFRIPAGPTRYMAHHERVWSGVRMHAVGGNHHASMDVTKDLVLGRRNRTCNIISRYVSRRHLEVSRDIELLYPDTLTVTVHGINGVLYSYNGKIVTYEQGERFVAKIGSVIELVPLSGVRYRISYV